MPCGLGRTPNVADHRASCRRERRWRNQQHRSPAYWLRPGSAEAGERRWRAVSLPPEWMTIVSPDGFILRIDLGRTLAVWPNPGGRLGGRECLPEHQF